MIKVWLMHAFNASTFSFNKVLLDHVPPLLLAGISALGGGLVLMITLFFTSERKQFDVKMISRIFPIAFCITFAAGILRFYALAHLSSYQVAFFSALDPLLTAILSYFLKGQSLNKIEIVGVTGAIVGSIPMLLSMAHAPGQTTIAILPMLAVFGYIIINRYGWIKMSDVTREQGYSVSHIVSIMSLMGGSLSLGSSLIVDRHCTSLLSCFFSFPLLCMFVYVMLISTLVCSQAYTSLLKEYSVTFMSLTEFLTPLFVTFYGWLFLHEKITYHFFLSALLVLTSLAIFTFSRTIQNKIMSYRNQKGP